MKQQYIRWDALVTFKLGFIAFPAREEVLQMMKMVMLRMVLIVIRPITLNMTLAPMNLDIILILADP